MTPIDSVYEYAGYTLAGRLHGLFGSVGLPAILALSGIAWAAHLMVERGSARELGVYFIYLIFAAWVLSTTQVQGVAAPRFVAYLGEGADHLQRRAVKGIQSRFLDSPFEWERVAAMASMGRILDPGLAAGSEEFLEACAKPALAQGEPGGSNLFRPGALSYGAACEKRRAALWQGLREHVERHPFHRTLLETARRRSPGEAAAFLDRYLDEICLKAVDDPTGPTGEMSLVRASIGDYSYTDPAQSGSPLPWWAKAGIAASSSVPFESVDAVFNFTVSGFAELSQGWDNRFSSKQRYYLVTVYGPHVYGLALLLVIGLFPVAGLFALLPGKWRVLLNYARVFISIKLWPVCWAALSSFNARRSALEAFDPSERGAGDTFLAVASMYVLTPAIAFLVVQLVSTAAAMPFAQALPPASGPGLGPAGPAINVAVRSAK